MNLAEVLPDLESDLFVSPGSRHDDQSDSIGQALLNENTSFMSWLTREDRERILAQSRISSPSKLSHRLPPYALLFIRQYAKAEDATAVFFQF